MFVCLNRDISVPEILFLLIEDVIEAYYIEVSSYGEILNVRIVTIFADQPQDYSILGFKEAGSFMDCALCIQRTLTFSDDPNDQIELSEEMQLDTGDAYIRNAQLTHASSQARDVIYTVSLQLILAVVQ